MCNELVILYHRVMFCHREKSCHRVSRYHPFEDATSMGDGSHVDGYLRPGGFRRRCWHALVLLILTLLCGDLHAQDEAEPMLYRLNVKDADLRDVLLGIGREHNINLVVDNRINQRVTLRLSEMVATEAIAFLCDENGLLLQRRGRVLRVLPPPEKPPPPPPPLEITFSDSLLTLDLRQADLTRAIRKIQEVTGANIVTRQGVKGQLSGKLSAVPLEVGLKALLSNNGFALRKRDGVYHIDRAGMTEEGGKPGSFWVQVDSTLISLDVAEVPIARVLREISRQLTSVGLVAYAAPEGNITARVQGLELEETLDLLLKGTTLTYRRHGQLYSIGSKATQGIATTALVRLGHLRADAALELVPELIKAEAGLHVVKEHNGLMVTGSSEVIQEVRHFIQEIDHPTPQILIEALVVDFQTSDLYELGLSFGRNPEVASEENVHRGRYNFGSGENREGGFEWAANGTRIREHLDRPGSLGNLLGIHKIGRLPEDFFFQLHALDRDGKINIRSRPQVATLNGHKANISIGTTQYYLLNQRLTPFQQTGQVPLVSESQRFEKIEASVKLEITPWVSASGEVTAEIRPEFSSPVGDFDPDVPPTINSRVLESTVRLRDGETIILGGLIRESEEVTMNKVPILGSIPLLGRLFRSERRDKQKAELVIFLTPHVFYGDADDDDKWNTLRDQLNLSGDKTLRMGHTELPEK